MVTVTNRAPLSHVFQVKDGDKVVSKSLPPGATDTFDLARDPDPLVNLLAKAGDIIVKPDAQAKAAAPNPSIPQAGRWAGQTADHLPRKPRQWRPSARRSGVDR